MAFSPFLATEGKLYDSTSGDGLEPLFRERPLGGNAIAFLGDVPDAAMSPQVKPSGMSKDEEEDWENYKWKEREAAEEERKRREAENEIRREDERRAERERVRRAGLTPEQRKAEDEYIEKLREATLARERAERRCDEDYHLAMQTAHSEWWSCSTECWENFLLCVAADVAARGGIVGYLFCVAYLNQCRGKCNDDYERAKELAEKTRDTCKKRAKEDFPLPEPPSTLRNR